jgi:hypothetical protein
MVDVNRKLIIKEPPGNVIPHKPGSVVSIDSDEPLVRIWKDKIYPWFFLTIVAIITAPLVIGYYFHSIEAAGSGFCFSSVILGCLGIVCPSFHYNRLKYFDFRTIRIEEEAVTFIRRPNKYIPVPYLCRIPFSDIHIIRYNRDRHEIVRMDASVMKIPHAFREAKVIRKLVMTFHSYLKNSTGRNVPVFLSASDIEKDQDPYGIPSSSFRVGNQSQEYGVISTFTFFLVPLTLIIVFEMTTRYLENGTIDFQIIQCFGLSSFLLIFLLFWSRSYYEDLEIHKRLFGLKLIGSINRRFYIVIARGEGFENLQKKLKWDRKLSKYRRGEGSFRESIMTGTRLIVSVFLLVLFFINLFAIVESSFNIIVERQSSHEIWNGLIQSGIQVYFPALLITYGILHLLSKQIKIHSDKDVKRINRLIGERYWKGWENKKASGETEDHNVR